MIKSRTSKTYGWNNKSLIKFQWSMFTEINFFSYPWNEVNIQCQLHHPPAFFPYLISSNFCCFYFWLVLLHQPLILPHFPPKSYLSIKRKLKVIYC
jgi:hypothetical protein